MSLMLRLLIATLLLGSSVFAGSDEVKVEKFLKKSFHGNRNIVSLKISVDSKAEIKQLKGWYAYIVDIDALVKSRPKNRKVKQKSIWFSNGDLITQDLVDINTGESLQNKVKPTISPEQYKKENLIYGNADAKHKVVIFSDPLCPFCKRFAPGAIEYLKARPKEFALYYIHTPLERLHPASVALVKAAVAAELKGYEDVIPKLYNVKLNPRETNINKILKAFNKALNSDIKPADLKSKAVLDRFNNDKKMAYDLMVSGTPTVFFDGQVDKSRSKFKRVK